MVGSIAWFTRILHSLEPYKGGGAEKRKQDNFSDDDSKFDILAVQREQKCRECSDLHFRPSALPLFGTNSYHFKMILGWLSEGDITTIGIYGMGGIGKTALTKQVYKWVLNHGTPSNKAMAWVPVGVHFTLLELQSKLADQLGFDLQNDKDEVRRAATLHSHLSCMRNIVIILDDLWDDFRLELVGIPKQCKLLITSRSLDVCRRMRCQKVLKIEPLPQEEAWQLFSDSVGYGIMETVELRQIAELVCSKCAGVPRAITMLAKSMRGVVDASRWRQALDGINSIPEMEDIFSNLKLSYSNLNHVTLQCCFLYCALYPKDYTIDKEELIRLWIGEMLIDDVLPLQPQYDKGHSIMNKLLNSSLLEASKDKRLVKIHDLISDMAIAITKGTFMVKAGMRLIEIPAEYEWRKDLHVASFIKSSISDIPLDASPKCPNLSTLLLHHNPIQVIPDSFFLEMCSLRFLNLSYTCIKRLPSSLSELEDLRILDVSYCQYLNQVPSLEKLKKLWFLDLSNTAIGQFPCCLGRLKMLRELNLSFIPTLNKFPSGILPALNMLKKLSCSVGGNISELQNSSSLEILDVNFTNLSDLSSYVRSQHWRSLECFHLQAGHNLRFKKQCSRGVSLHGCSFAGKEGDCVVLPDNIEELYIADCRGFSSLSNIMNSVDACDYRNCHSWCDPNCVPMTNCDKDGSKQEAGAFSSLEVCTIKRCPDVEKLFPPAWTQKLRCLEVLKIEDCLQLKELIAGEDGKNSHSQGTSAVISIPQLKELVLTSLPKLSSIYSGRVICESLQSLTFLDCPKLNRLPFSFYRGDQKEFTLSSLEKIEAQEKWWELLEWDHSETKNLLKPLFKGVNTK